MNLLLRDCLEAGRRDGNGVHIGVERRNAEVAAGVGLVDYLYAAGGGLRDDCGIGNDGPGGVSDAAGDRSFASELRAGRTE